MKVGFVNIYPYRPHAHQAKYLEEMAKSLGWQTYALVCDSNVSHCYLRELKGTGRSECAKCIVGGLRSFSFDCTDSAWRYWGKSKPQPEHEAFVESSSYTLTRVESWEQRQSQLVEDKKNLLLSSSVNFYYAALRWIEHRKLNAVVAFNGRMDLTRAVIEACKTAGIPFITHERPLFGHGLILNRNANCSSLEGIHKINQEFASKSLTDEQCKIAAKLAAERLTGGNPLEWKRYNSNAVKTATWPVKSVGPKVLVCPSSKNELLGHPDWATDWKDNTDALDMAVSHGWFEYSDMLVRFHPSWSVSFGKISAHLCEQHYRQWCEKRGVAFVESSSKTSTQDLIRLADVIVLNGSNTIFEAGIIGKPVICLGPSPYTFAGASFDVLRNEDFARINFGDVLRSARGDLVTRTLRYFYSKAAREPIFTRFVRSKTVTECAFYDGADPTVLADLVSGDRHIIDDVDYAHSSEAELRFVNMFLSADEGAMIDAASYAWSGVGGDERVISRRAPFALVDRIRGLTPKGV
ncbi:hypothetical protein IR012_01645 [Pseudomonas putida]|uniref:hypothetical protein n=1 Tax=Pseudomonas putida TaxID=303 RepID=UPI0018A9B1D3|nr:hypothetical protein [Pseudomonas putida]MBF8669042.1 hypothetical protein [Pseudomonas putida]MBF8711011.1 hypothetical protein [Pseudomonas putida]